MQILVRVLLTVESICSTSIRVVGEMKNPVTRKVLIYFIGFVGGDSGSYYIPWEFSSPPPVASVHLSRRETKMDIGDCFLLEEIAVAMV